MTIPGLDEQTRALVLANLRRLGGDELAPAATLRWDAADAPPVELLRRLLGPAIGLHLVFLPPEHGGLGAGARDVALVAEELARYDLGVATAFLGLAISANPMRAGGTPAQRERWLGAMAARGLLAALAVTEPEGGSNVAALATTATPVVADGQPPAYRLDGTKQFVSNGGLADLYLVLAQAPGGPSFFIVEAGTPGLKVQPREAKHGLRSSATAPIVLEDAVVPADQLLGGVEGQGLAQANAVFAHSRLMVAAFGLGAGEAALGRAVAYSQDRQQGGKPLCRLKGFTHKLLIPHVVRLEAARGYVAELAQRLDAGETDLDVEGAAAKLFATEAGSAAADAAVQAHGGYGYLRDFVVEKIRRDVRVTTIYEGTSELQQAGLYLARFRTMLRTKGGFYREAAARVRPLGPAVAADLVADTAEALGHAVWTLHQAKISREQHVMFELADRIAEVEHALAFCRHAANAAAPLQAACRLFAAEAARAVAVSAVRVMAASRAGEPELTALAHALKTDALLATRYGSDEDKEQVLGWVLAAGWPG
ncbi:MAG TPA: acyl-CoA dehydrogenase family protein [Polyangia bacterium]|jgi:alkylation response protein AidB-like acyl-CoA dehydrogenase